MKNRVYINGSCAISAQPTFEGDFLDNINENVQDNVLPVIEPNYRDYIAPSAIRRMSRAVKMGIVASKRALGEACLELPEAIAVGTGMGKTPRSFSVQCWTTKSNTLRLRLLSNRPTTLWRGR